MLDQLSAAIDVESETVGFLKRFKATTKRKLSLTRLESLQRLGELVSWLYLYDRDEEVLGVARPLLGYEFDANFTRYGPVASALALAGLVAERHGDEELARDCREHIINAYGRREEWSKQRRDAMRNRLGGWQVEWQEGNRVSDDPAYTRAQLGELAFMRIWGGEQSWPLDRIERTFEEKTSYLRQLKKINP